MSIIGKIQSLFSDREKTQPIFPITKTKAVSDDNGVSLDVLLAAKASESFVTNKIAEAQLGGGEGGDIDLSGYATKDDLSAIDFPVDSVNGKTGAVTLSASDVGALPISGGTMTGNVNMGGYQITGFAEPNGATQAATKNYVDTAVGTKQDAITGLTPSMVMICNSSGQVTTSSQVSTGELGYLNGVTSNIQTQLNSKAPDGYGLGMGSTSKAVKSITANGWYITNVDTPSSTWLLCHARVTNNGSDITVEGWNLNGTAKYKITKRNGTWGDWEYEIPLMTVGIEYPTTEKYMGKTVWTVIVDLGTCPVGETIVNTDFAATAVVRQAGVQSVYESARNDKYMHVHMASVEYGKLTVVVVKGTMLSSAHEYCQVWYTKD